jgi:hypothetical protein
MVVVGVEKEQTVFESVDHMQHFLNFILIIKTKILKEREKDQPTKKARKERKERKRSKQRNRNRNRPSVYVVDFPSKRKGL